MHGIFAIPSCLRWGGARAPTAAWPCLTTFGGDRDDFWLHPQLHYHAIKPFIEFIANFWQSADMNKATFFVQGN